MNALTVLKAVVVPPHPMTREGVFDAFVEGLEKHIAALKKKATSADLAKIDLVYIAIQEVKLLKTLDMAGVGKRIKELAESKPEDEFELALKEGGLAIISLISAEMKKIIK